MTAPRRTSIERISDLNSLRLRLLICSLFLTAFEVLKSVIIDGVADFYVDRDPVSERRHEEFIERLKSIGVTEEEIEDYRLSVETFSSQVDKYEEEVGRDFGLRFRQRKWKGLVPSCEWLRAEQVLTEDDIEQVRRLREQRNHIAHHLYDVLISGNLGFDVDCLLVMRDLLKKVELHWMRLYISIENPEICDIPDDDIFCPRLFVIDQIGRSVVGYVDEVARQRGRSDEQVKA